MWQSNWFDLVVLTHTHKKKSQFGAKTVDLVLVVVVVVIGRYNLVLRWSARIIIGWWPFIFRRWRRNRWVLISWRSTVPVSVGRKKILVIESKFISIFFLFHQKLSLRIMPVDAYFGAMSLYLASRDPLPAWCSWWGEPESS